MGEDSQQPYDDIDIQNGTKSIVCRRHVGLGLTDKHKGNNMGVIYTGLSLQRERCIDCFPDRRLETNIDSLATSVLSVCQATQVSIDSYLQFILVNLQPCSPPDHYHELIYLGFASSVNLQNLSLWRMSRVLYKHFSAQSLNQYQLLSCGELYFLLASLGLTL